MSAKARLTIIFCLNGLFLFLDQWLKWLSLRALPAPALINKYFGWYPSLNPGIAFNIPLPNILIIFFTIPIIIILAYLFFKNTNFLARFSLIMIIFGAISNLFDRIYYQNTVDYFLLLTAVINLADAMIVVGFLFYLIQNKIIQSRKNT